MDAPMWLFYVVLLIGVLTLIWKLNHEIKAETPIEWWHFIASKGKNGEYYADRTALGQVLGIILVVWLAITLSARVKDLDWVGFCAILTIVLSYLAGVQAYQAYLKSKRDDKAEPKDVAP